MDAKIEFCCGLAYLDGNFLATFGYQDNAAFVLSIPENYLLELVGL